MAEGTAPVFVFACVSCGKTVSGNEKSCPRCGASFEEVRFECPFCGDLVSPDLNKCPGCGTEFSVFAEEVAENASIELDGGESPEAAQPSPEQSVEFECPSCGGKVSESDTKCPHCGAVFSE